MNTFPTLSRGPSRTFSDEPDPNAVLVESTASGYPVLNKLFTFDPRTFTPELRSTSEADKLTVMSFYEHNKDLPIYWLNTQDSIEYEVAFVSKPRCRMDGRKDLWRIQLNLRQTSASTSITKKRIAGIVAVKCTTSGVLTKV